jgi:ABC-type glutathione transport system ATPase component
MEKEDAALNSSQEKAREALIKTDNLWKTYVMGDEEIHALRGVSFEIRRNEYVAIIGPSGSGKSTLMNLIGCLDTPSKGEYWSTTSWSPRWTTTNSLTSAIRKSDSSSRPSIFCPEPLLCTTSNCR